MSHYEKGNRYNIENVRNIDNSLNNVLGVCKEKTFISTIANMHGIDLHNYKVVKKIIQELLNDYDQDYDLCKDSRDT